MIDGWLRAGLIALLAAGWSACAFDADYHRTRYQCDDGTCPSGYACSRGYCEPVSQGARPSGVQDCGTTDLLASDFEGEELETAVWHQGGYNMQFTHVEGRLQIAHGDPAAEASGGYVTNRMYLLGDSRVSVEVPDYDPATGATLTFEIEADGGNDVNFELSGGELRLTYEVSGSRYVSSKVDYDPVAHRFWQIREEQGSIYWEASGNGETWELMTTASSLPFTGLVLIRLLAYLPGEAPVTAPVFFDQINGGQLDESKSWCSVSALRDDFNDGLVGSGWWAWTDRSCSFFERNGAVLFDYADLGPGACGYESKTYYDLSGSSIAVEVPQVDETGAIRTLFFLQFQNGKEISFEHTNLSEEQTNQLVCRNNLIESGATPCTLNYAQDEHRWWRFRHDDGAALLQWETSPDGRKWTTHGQYDVSGEALPGAIVHLISDSYIEEGRSDATNQFDNLNTGAD